MKNYTFSVILPTYNRAYILWKALLSIQNQRYPYWHVYIIDDGSSDDTYKLVKEFKEPRFNYLYEKNAGPCVARNLGLAHATSDYIAYLDSDNTYHDDYLLYVNEHINHNPQAKFGICSENIRWELYDKKANLIKVTEESSSFGEEVPLQDLVMRTKRFDTNALFHIRDTQLRWEKSVKFMHDWELILSLAEKYPTGFVYIPLALVDYYSRYGKDGLCANATYAQWQGDYKAILKLHKSSTLRPPDAWFAEKIAKYDTLIQHAHGNDVAQRTQTLFHL